MANGYEGSQEELNEKLFENSIQFKSLKDADLSKIAGGASGKQVLSACAGFMMLMGLTPLTNFNSYAENAGLSHGSVQDKDFVEKNDRVNEEEKFGFTPLHTPLHDVAESGNIKNFKILCEKRLGWINAQDEDGFTPLYTAVMNKHWSIAKYLIVRGADVNLKNKYGCNALHCALCGYIDVDLVKCLVDHGADVNAKNGYGANVLHYALTLENPHMNLVKYFVKHGADVNLQRDDGCTPLHVAVQDNCAKVAKQLVECGADVNIKDNNGVTPLYYAVRSGNLGIVKCLVENGADVNTKDNLGNTLLHMVVMSHDFVSSEFVEYLVKQGANVNAKNNEGQTVLGSLLRFWGPEYRTIDNRVSAVVDYLRSQGAVE